MKILLALALMATTSGTALAFQQQPPPADEAVDALPLEQETDAADSSTGEVPADAPEADEGAEEGVEVDAEADYRAAVRSFRKCRQTALRQGGVAAATNNCGSQRRRMLSAKEALREKK